MKYYIILQPSIRSMGGEEIYTRNKVVEAKKHGYVPIVFHSGIGEKVMIEDLKCFDCYEIPEMRYEPCTISSGRKKKLIQKLCDILKNCGPDSVVESHEMLVAEWGEIFAETLNIKHLVFLLLEHHQIFNDELYSFFKFKYQRHELVGIAEQTLKELLNREYEVVKGYYLPAYCNNSFEDSPCPKDFIVGDADYTIGTVGRTDKAYVIPMLEAIVRFAKKHSNKSFNILYIGGSMSKQSERKVKEIFKNSHNVKLYFTGMIFPIPISMIRQSDVCLCSAGSCRVTERCGVPTISIDGNDSKAIGLFQITTQHSLFRDTNEPPIEIEDMLDKILIKGDYKEKKKPQKQIMDWSSHWEFIDRMSKDHEYFDISRIEYSSAQKFKSLLLGYLYGTKPGSFKNVFISSILNILSSLKSK